MLDLVGWLEMEVPIGRLNYEALNHWKDLALSPPDDGSTRRRKEISVGRAWVYPTKPDPTAVSRSSGENTSRGSDIVESIEP
jgi:hypothetical protein